MLMQRFWLFLCGTTWPCSCRQACCCQSSNKQALRALRWCWPNLQNNMLLLLLLNVMLKRSVNTCARPRGSTICCQLPSQQCRSGHASTPQQARAGKQAVNTRGQQPMVNVRNHITPDLGAYLSACLGLSCVLHMTRPASCQLLCVVLQAGISHQLYLQRAPTRSSYISVAVHGMHHMLGQACSHAQHKIHTVIPNMACKQRHCTVPCVDKEAPTWTLNM